MVTMPEQSLMFAKSSEKAVTSSSPEGLPLRSSILLERLRRGVVGEGERTICEILLATRKARTWDHKGHSIPPGRRDSFYYQNVNFEQDLDRIAFSAEIVPNSSLLDHWKSWIRITQLLT